MQSKTVQQFTFFAIGTAMNILLSHIFIKCIAISPSTLTSVGKKWCKKTNTPCFLGGGPIK